MIGKIDHTVGVEVHIGNEEMCREPSISSSFDSPAGELSGLNLIRDF